MLDALGFASSLISILIGGVLVYDTVSKVGPTESTILVVGAVFLSAGFVGVSLAGKSWWEWRKIFKGDDSSA
jgi:hypothetical protein